MSETEPNTTPTSAPLVPKVPPPAPRKPQIGDSIPGPTKAAGQEGTPSAPGEGTSASAKRRRRRSRGGGGGGGSTGAQQRAQTGNGQGGGQGGQGGQNRNKGGGQNRGGGGGRQTATPVEAVLTDDDGGVQLDAKTLKKRQGRSRNGRAVGRYQMNVHVDTAGHTHIAVLEGRSLIEHYVSRPSDDVSQIHGNIYLGRVENVLPGMEAAFIDIATPKNAVLYRGDVHLDADDVAVKPDARIEDVLKPKQLILCQVTKNPIGHKGARLTQEVSLPGRFVVLVPNSKTYGISKRLSDQERKRLRSILDRVKPAHHGVIVRTAAENVTSEEIERDVTRLLKQWDQISALAAEQKRPSLLYREPDMAVRVIREEFNEDYRAVIIDDPRLYSEVHDYVAAISPATGDRVQHYDLTTESLSLFERFQITEQLKKGLDRKVWLPSGGSLIIEHTEALTVIDVNTGRNVGSSSLEETVFRNNLEAAVEIARQLRLRDIGGIIVIDFVDMEVKSNRDELVRTFKEALSRDKTRTQVFSVSELGLVEMTRKRIGEGLLESFADQCSVCNGRGIVLSSAVVGID
ncbi:MAG: Rne/Rng family ribonuclease [Acidimicrobiales bacterium]